ncbi:magnesium transporter [Legionella yabuuchiae]|uniref:magnesium transporter n=1 Tax=Legionella yabuuchiae TaxID=376727 RepID=UPI0013EFB6A0|nr:magnesium transporter [Legionella yabuuchiae]
MGINKKNLPEKELSRLLSEASVNSIVKEVDHSSPERRYQIFNLLPPQKADKVFSYLEPVSQADILNEIDKKKALAILEQMEPDDRARLFDELPSEKADRFLRRLSAKERRATSLLLQYSPETAGRIMSPFFIPLYPDMTVEKALEIVRKDGNEAETIYVLPVVNDDMILKGVVELEKLVMASPSSKISELMYKDMKSFSVNDDQEKVARYIQSTDWLAVPIVEEGKRLVGIVTIDDAMDIMEEEETEDIFRAGASGPLGKPYLSVPIFRLLQIRVVWLAFLAIAGTLTVNVLNTFESTLNEVIVLTLFIPLLIGIGGNTGSQSSTTIVRALAVEDVRVSDFLTIALRETSVGVLLGIALGAAAYVVVWYIFRQNIALIVALSLVAICTMAALTGSIMPILARILNLDPAVVSAPFVSTVIDASGLIIYFMIARTVLNF